MEDLNTPNERLLKLIIEQGMETVKFLPNTHVLRQKYFLLAKTAAEIFGLQTGKTALDSVSVLNVEFLRVAIDEAKNVFKSIPKSDDSRFVYFDFAMMAEELLNLQKTKSVLKRKGLTLKIVN